MLFLTIIAIILYFLIPILVVVWLFEKYESDLCPEIYTWGTFIIEIAFFLSDITLDGGDIR